MFRRLRIKKKAIFWGILLLLTVSGGAAVSPHSRDTQEAAARGITIATHIGRQPQNSDDSAGRRGVLTASLMSTPLYAPSLAAGNQGITLAMRLGDENLLQPGEFAAEIGLISRLDALANLQPWAAMANAVDRAARYQELETTFAETIAEATAARQRLEESRQELTGKVRQMQAEREDYEKRYFAALNAGSSQNAQKWHGLFVESQVAWVKERAELGKINGILSRVTRQINPVRTQYAALKNNRDALIAGIRVDAKTARAAGVVGTANP